MEYLICYYLLYSADFNTQEYFGSMFSFFSLKIIIIRVRKISSPTGILLYNESMPNFYHTVAQLRACSKVVPYFEVIVRSRTNLRVIISSFAF